MSILDQRKLNAEAHNDSKNQDEDKNLKGSESLNSSMRTIEEEDNHDIKNRDGATSDKRDRRSQEI